MAARADLPRSYRQLRAQVAAWRRQARELEEAAALLDRMLPGLMCDCEGGAVIPRDRKTGVLRIDATYAVHALECTHQ